MQFRMYMLYIICRPGFCFTEGYVAPGNLFMISRCSDRIHSITYNISLPSFTPGAYTLIVSAFDASMQGASLVVLAAEASTYLVATQVRIMQHSTSHIMHIMTTANYYNVNLSHRCEYDIYSFRK